MRITRRTFMQGAAIAFGLGLAGDTRASKPQTQYKLFMPMVSLQRNPKHGVVDLSGTGVLEVRAQWTYVYGPWSPSYPGVECIPMIQQPSNLPTPLGGNSQWLLGFNEPDLPGTAFQSPDEAAIVWRQLEGMFPNRKFVAPAPGCGDTFFDLLGWVHAWREAYHARYASWPKMDALPVHTYFTTAANGISVLMDAIAHANEWGVPEVWVTEFGMPDSDPTPESFAEMQTFIGRCNTEAMVKRYSWFGTHYHLGQPWIPRNWRDVSLVDDSGVLTAWGEQYVRFA